jgi:Spy/CpxP family protein refolding chaperone
MIRVLSIRSQGFITMPNKLSRFLTASLFTTSLVLAQGMMHTPPDPATMAQHRVARLTTLLNLTAAQQQQATTIFTTSGTADQAARTSMQTARTALNTAIKNNDAGGIEQASTTLGNLTAQTTMNDSKAQAAFLQLLTPDQQTKYNAIGTGGYGASATGACPASEVAPGNQNGAFNANWMRRGSLEVVMAPAPAGTNLTS